MKKKPIKLSILAAISVLVLIVLTLPAWRSVLIYYEYRQGYVETITTECTSITVDRTYELRRFTPYFTIYCFHLRDETTVSIYKDTAIKVFASEDEMKRQILGKPISFTYVQRPTFSNGSYPLVAAVDKNGTSVIEQAIGVSPFYERVRTVVIVDLICICLAVMILVLPMLPYLSKKLKHRKNRRRKKQHKIKAKQLGDGSVTDHHRF